MANTFFKFKQFTVHQQLSAMKVTTDACIFGAVVAERFADMELQATVNTFNYLDIGTGTGLLSLMLAQKTSALIDAVEIDKNAFEEAASNFKGSPFTNRLSIFNSDILSFKSEKSYEGIICNPPFYEADLTSPDINKNNARHAIALTLRQLLDVVKNHLKDDGIFAVLLPHSRSDEFIETAALLNFYLKEKLLVKHSPAHPYFRVILFFTKIKTTSTINELIIKNEQDNYADDFIKLLKDYYLYL